MIEQIASSHDWLFERSSDRDIAVEVTGHWCDYRMFVSWHADVQALLADALTEQREKNRIAAQSLLDDTAYFKPKGEDWLLTLTDAEIERFLQILNDLRVGSWLALDCPGQDEDGSYINFENVTAENVTDIWTMEVCGALQHELLKALHEEY